MATYTTTVHSAWNADEAFRYMSDFSNAQHWDPSVTSAHRLDEGAVTLQSLFDLTVHFAGREKLLRYGVTSLDPSRGVVFTSSTNTLLSRDTLTFEPRTAGCEMTYRAELRFRGVASVANPLLALLFRRLGDRARDSLRSILGTSHEV